MWLSVPCNITLHATRSTKVILWGTEIECSLLVLQKRVICPRMHSHKEQNFSSTHCFFPVSTLTRLNLRACQFFFTASLHWRFISSSAQVPFCYAPGYFIFRKWHFLLLPLSTSPRVSHLSVLNSRVFTWPASGQRPSPGDEWTEKEGQWPVVTLYWAPWHLSHLQAELWKPLLRRQSSVPYTQCGMI